MITPDITRLIVLLKRKKEEYRHGLFKKMNYIEAKELLEQTASRGILPGLDRMKSLLTCLGRPDREQNFIHIAGTNGKGSTGAYLANILKEAGFRVGRYVSPAVSHYLEHFMINEGRMQEEIYVEYAQQILEACDRLASAGCELPSIFEIETAIAMLFFADEACDFTILEVGMGGLSDATNVIEAPILTLITPISQDHVRFLGNTIEEIAYQKAGIIKGGHPVILGVQPKEAKAVIYNEYTYREREKALAKEKDGQAAPSPFRSVDPGDITILHRDLEEQCFRYHNYELTTSLAGAYQPENAAAAILAAETMQEMGYSIKTEHILEGVANTEWFGRFTVIPGSPVLILDGAHNVDGAARLADSLREYFPNEKVYFIVGVFKDKNYEAMLDLTLPYCRRMFAVSLPDWNRGLSPQVLKMEGEKRGISTEVSVNYREAAKSAAQAAGPDGIVVAWGSLSYLTAMEEVWIERNLTC